MSNKNELLKQLREIEEKEAEDKGIVIGLEITRYSEARQVVDSSRLT